MSSAYIIVKQTPFVVAPRSRTMEMDTTPPANDSCSSLWRPWLLSSKDAHHGSKTTRQSCPYSRPSTAPGSVSFDAKPQAFQHPVRLFWPRSKSYDYLYRDGEALLRNFPVQATISFYEESDSEEEEDGWEEDWDSGEDEERLKPQTHSAGCN